jgi:hypothetical protein
MEKDTKPMNADKHSFVEDTSNPVIRMLPLAKAK